VPSASQPTSSSRWLTGLGTPAPYFSEPRRDFYNLELIDTNKADYTVCYLPAPLTFAV